LAYPYLYCHGILTIETWFLLPMALKFEKI